MAAVETTEQLVEVASKIDSARVGFFIGGTGFGLIVGFYLGYRFNREKIRAEVFKQAEEEIAEIRAMYVKKRFQEPKPELEEIIERQGYREPELQARPLPAPVPVHEPIRSQNVFNQQTDDWDYAVELPQRSKNHPYVIHQDEFTASKNSGEYQQITWTYYAGDNVLCDERDQAVMRPELVVGEENLKKFGHGSDDTNVVYIRNDRIEMEFEICRSFQSYEVEVLGHDDSEDQEPTGE